VHATGELDDPRVDEAVTWLLDQRLADGGWNCETIRSVVDTELPGVVERPWVLRHRSRLTGPGRLIGPPSLGDGVDSRP
jgi:hypothetical protein